MVSSVAELDTDISGACIQHVQLSCGEFGAQLQRVMLKESAFDSGLFNQRVCGVGTMPTDAYTFLFLPTHRDAGHLNSNSLVSGVWLYQPGDEIYGTLPADFQWFSFSVPRISLEERLQSVGLDSTFLRKLGTGPLTAQTELEHLKRTIQGVYRDGRVAGEIGSADNVEENLIFAFRDAIGPAPSKHIGGRRQHSALLRAEEVLRACVNRPITTTELCQYLGCSRRQIEKEFKNTYGMGPITCHRRQRLNEARRRLLVDDRGHGSVSEAAFDFGFTHLGRFAADYKSLFGESPRQTAKR